MMKETGKYDLKRNIKETHVAGSLMRLLNSTVYNRKEN